MWCHSTFWASVWCAGKDAILLLLLPYNCSLICCRNSVSGHSNVTVCCDVSKEVATHACDNSQLFSSLLLEILHLCKSILLSFIWTINQWFVVLYSISQSAVAVSSQDDVSCHRYQCSTVHFSVTLSYLCRAWVAYCPTVFQVWCLICCLLESVHLHLLSCKTVKTCILFMALILLKYVWKINPIMCYLRIKLELSQQQKNLCSVFVCY